MLNILFSNFIPQERDLLLRQRVGQIRGKIMRTLGKLDQKFIIFNCLFLLLYNEAHIGLISGKETLTDESSA